LNAKKIKSVHALLIYAMLPHISPAAMPGNAQDAIFVPTIPNEYATF
jgi:hypothetical protein